MEALSRFVNGATDIMLGYGLQGVVMVALGFAVVKLYKRNCVLQDARVMDAATQMNALNMSTAALNRMSDALIQNSKTN